MVSLITRVCNYICLLYFLIYLGVDYKQCLDDIVNKAKESLLCGNVIAVPTDTIYGVAALAQSTQAVSKMYDIKQRHKEKAVSICVGAIQDVKRSVFFFFFFFFWGGGGLSRNKYM